MKKKHITILGSFKNGEIAFDGQTSKTRNYSEEICSHYSDCIVYKIDTQAGLRVLISHLIIVFYRLLSSDIVFILPGKRGIKKILPIVFLFKKIKRYLLLYPVVGGWLPDYIKDYPMLQRMLHSVDRIYVETKQMKSNLEKMNYSNVELAPVFTRRTASQNSKWNCLQRPYSLCTFSRVTPTKGIDTAIEAINRLNQDANDCKYTLSIYGKIDPDYKDAFLGAISNSAFNAIQYGGALDDNEVMDKLASHWIMLFPTRYPGEGFPATVLEGMMAGLPIIASDWKYNSEIIEDGYNGLLFDLESKENGLIEKIKYLSENQDIVISMHNNSLEKAKRFSPAVVLEPMFTLINTFLNRDHK